MDQVNTKDTQGLISEVRAPLYPTPARARYSLVILLAAYILSFVDRQILNLMVAPIRVDLSITDFEISLLQGMAFALFYSMLGIPLGRLADLHNRKRIICIGMFLWSLMTVLCGGARTFGVLFLARMGVGIGEATLSPSAYSILSDSFKAKQLARATSIFTMGITVGGGLAYLVGGSVIAFVDRLDVSSLPIISGLRPWQLAFMAVGLPGLVVSFVVLTMQEPSRQGLMRGNDSQTATHMPMADVLRFLATRWRSYGPIYAGVSILGILGYGYLTWYPTFLMRTYGLSASDVGLRFGAIYLIFGSAGAFMSAVVSESLNKSGYKDSNPRTIIMVAVALLVPATTGPLMPSPALALAVMAPTVFLLNAYFGVAMAALQIVTPNQMRAVMSAIFLLFSTLIGLGIGASLIAFMTDFVFGNDMALKYSLAAASVIVCPLAATIIWAGLKPYRAALDEATSWNIDIKG